MFTTVPDAQDTGEALEAFSSTKLAARLTAEQLFRSVAFGIAFWFSAALFVHYTAGIRIFGGLNGLLTFAISIPVCWASVRLVMQIAQLRNDQVVMAVVAATIAATILDGIAMTWIRSLYGSSVAAVQNGAAWILFGVGVILWFAVLESQKPGEPL